MKDWVKYQNRDCVMQFLMGLNESYAQIRAQVLMMDPIPAISKIFSLVVQEERQRSIHSDISGSSLDRNPILSPKPINAAVKGSSYGKGDKGGKSDNLTCSHCHYTGHTIDKCYQLHGYPPSHPKYKQKQPAFKVRANVVPNVLKVDPQTNLQSEKDSNKIGNELLSPERCRQLLDFLSTQLQLGHGTTTDSKQLESSASCLSGHYQEQEDWDG
ncbi:uncharacterized protein [Primulina huaijiensis]|uniref:uncharacterized protein n=1 Tax=Primulina huaijiensis TaxID=1492673 RepID=UPI003CC73ACC